MKKLLSLAALTALCAVAPLASAATKKPVKKYNKRPAKVAPKKTVVRTAKVAPSKAAPPSKATRPTGYYDNLAHKKAIDLTKQAADAYARGDYNRAIALSKAASDSYPTYARAQTWLGASYHKLKRYDEAIKAYKWAMALAPGTVDAERAERGLKEIGY